MAREVCRRHSFKKLLCIMQTRMFCFGKLQNNNDKHLIAPFGHMPGSSNEFLQMVAQNFLIYENFISEIEEKNFISEIEPLIKRRRYEFDHWDGAIQGYKETEKENWNSENMTVIKRIRSTAFLTSYSLLSPVHVLDLSKMGHIKPHIDSVRFCGDTIAGLSLLSSCVMRLVKETNKDIVFDVLLPRRSLYVMKGKVRYDFTHEILEDKLSFFKSEHVPRERRISVICRNQPLNTI